MTKPRSGQPPEHSQFRKGQSGNPNGRPKREPENGRRSAFDIVVDKTLTITRDGVPREVSVEEALQHRSYEEAIAGNRAARRDVLKMIAKREQALAKSAPAAVLPVIFRTESDPNNANAALLILGIASENPQDYGPNDKYERLFLEPWAVQMALGRRRGGAKVTEKEIADIRRCTRDADSLRWPRGTRG